MSKYPPLLANVRFQKKKKPGRSDIQANLTGCHRTTRIFVLINSGASGQHRTKGIIIAEADGHSREKCVCADAGIASCGSQVKVGSLDFPVDPFPIQLAITEGIQGIFLPQFTCMLEFRVCADGLGSRSLTELTRLITSTQNGHERPPIVSRKSCKSVNLSYVWT